MGSLKICFLLAFLVLKLIHADTDTLSFDGYCSYSINTIYDVDTYHVEWTGSSVDGSPCTISFEADSFDSYDDYQVCVDVENFYIDNKDCGVHLTYSQGVNSEEMERYGCKDYPSYWCSNDNFADIKLYGAEEGASSSISGFTLRVTSVKTNSDLSTTVYICIAVGVVISIVFLTICFMIIRVARMRNIQRRAGQININPSHSYQSINTSGTVHPPYGVENPSSVHNYPPAYGYQGYLKSSRATPPPPYSVPSDSSTTTSGGNTI